MTTWRVTRPESGGAPRPALFVDRDGVVIADRDYLSDPDGVLVLPGAADALRRAGATGFLVIGVSNQSGIGRGYFGVTEFEAVMARLVADLAGSGARFDGFYYCPHGPADDCACRKPRTGLLDEAAATFRWDPARSWLVGDKVSDVALARAADLGAILVRTGYGASEEPAVARRWAGDDRVLVAADLAAAVDLILDRDRAGRR